MDLLINFYHNAEEAASAVAISKYPPIGKRSMTGQLPQFQYRTHPHATVISESNDIGSTVLVMIETREALENLDSIASVPGVNVLLVGANDLSIELEVPGHFDSRTFMAALSKIAGACSRHGKILGLAGIYDKPEILRWAVQELGVGWILGGQDASFIARGAKVCMDGLREAEKT